MRCHYISSIWTERGLQIACFWIPRKQNLRQRFDSLGITPKPHQWEVSRRQNLEAKEAWSSSKSTQWALGLVPTREVWEPVKNIYPRTISPNLVLFVLL